MDAVAADIAAQGTREVGITVPIILESDSGDDINALRRRVPTLHPGVALAQTPAAHEHEPSGAIEHGSAVGQGLLHVLMLALEGRASGRIPCPRPDLPGCWIMPAMYSPHTWLVRTARRPMRDCMASQSMWTPLNPDNSCGGGRP